MEVLSLLLLVLALVMLVPFLKFPLEFKVMTSVTLGLSLGAPSNASQLL